MSTHVSAGADDEDDVNVSIHVGEFLSLIMVSE